MRMRMKMYIINFFPSPLIISVMLLLSHNFLDSACAYDMNIPYSSCKSLFDCGGLRHEIRYPFWVNALNSKNCGHPKFELRCEGGELTIEILFQKYIVLNISYDTRILKIVGPYSFVCPSSDTKMDYSLFKYTGEDRNVTLLYDCDSDSQPAPTYNLSCKKENEKEAENGYLVIDTNPADQLASICNVIAVVPVLNTSVQGLGNHSLPAEKVLSLGFEVEWINVDEIQCRGCVWSEDDICRYNSNSTCDCDKSPPISCPNPLTFPGAASHSTESKSLKVGKKIILAIAAGGAGILFAVILIIFSFKRKTIEHGLMLRSHDNPNIEEFVRNYGSEAPKRYSYSDIKKMSNSFKDKIGQGGYGGVYKGKFDDGRFVAVKVLNPPKGNGEEFINEVASICRTSHVNIVKLLGFCFESDRKALIYEFMSNGSLEKFLCSENPLKASKHLGWEKLYQIAIGIARGLDYLHCGCRTKILHFDVKPHNILLDQDFSPKISDFGLAKLCPPKESIISMSAARGTIGYVAPEVFCRTFGRVSHKSDVYSYGMMILEMVGGRQNISGTVDHTSETYFPHWIYKHLEQQDDLGVLEGIENKEENEVTRKMIVVGLWCIQTDPSHRPCMSKVIEMLEGSIEALQIPPKPFLSSPPRFPLESSSLINSTLSQ